VRAPPLALAVAGFAALVLGAARVCAADTPPGPPPPSPPPDRDEETRPRLSDVRWDLAPIRWRGLLALDWRSFGAAGQPKRIQQVESAALQATSYVYQPWFAQLAFGVTGLTAKDHGEQSSRSNTLGGNALLSMFPTSRFPFQASAERSDSRSSEQFTGQDYQTQRMGARQSYRNVAGDANSNVGFDRSTLSSPSFGRDRVDVWNAGHSRHLDSNNFDANANRTRNSRGASGEFSQFDRVFGRHNYSAGGLFSAETLASYGAASQSVASADGTRVGLRNETLQLNSFGTWRPAEDDPLFVTGGGRFFQTRISDGASESETRSTMGYATANYRVSPNLLVNGGGSVTQNSGAADSVLLSSQFAGANYTPDARRFGEILYTSNLGVTATNQTGGEEGARRLLAAQATHGLNRLFELAANQSLGLNASQSLGLSGDSQAGSLRTLSHYGGASYRLTSGDSLSGFASASASDSRTSGYNSSTFQMLNLQLSGQAQFGRYSSLLANYTVQGTRQGSSQDSGQGFVVSANGGATYQHQRAFGVPQLRYLAIYERSDYQLNTRVQGDLSAPPEQFTWAFEQRLEYRIGKLEARLSYRLAEIDGRKNALLFFRLVRQFGD
jgi:hypothetical protein